MPTACPGSISRPRVRRVEASAQPAPTACLQLRSVHICAHTLPDYRQRWLLHGFCSSSLSCNAWLGQEQLATLEAEADRLWSEERAWAAGPRENVWSGTPTPSHSSQPGGPRNTCWLLLPSPAAVSRGQPLEIASYSFLQLRASRPTQEVSSHRLI